MKPYKLTTDKDRLRGTDRDDVFEAYLEDDVAGAYTLNNNDRIDGGKGVDRIIAVIGDETATPQLTSIEVGKFYLSEATATLDLSLATRMSSLQFAGSTADGSKSVTVLEAAALNELKISGGDSDTYLISGLAANRHDAFHLSVSGSSDLTVDTLSNANTAFDRLDVDLRDADFIVQGDLANSRTLSVTSLGNTMNYLKLDPDGASGVRNVLLDGDQSISLHSLADPLLGIRRFDSTGMAAGTVVRAEIGGASLTSVSGGKSADTLDIVSIGGTAKARAEVRLGAGADQVALAFAFDASTQFYDGGAGVDTLELTGAAANLRSAVKNFETIQLNDAIGTYDVTGMNLVNFLLFTTDGAVSVTGLASGATMGVYATAPDEVSVSVAGANGSGEDSLRLLMQNGADLGSDTAGFSAENLTNLELEATSGGSIVHLARLGAEDDASSIEIMAGGNIELAGTDGMATHIERLTVNEGASVDLSDLASRSGVFVDTGATITGASGDDVLAGGDGEDIIITGDGDNTVHGSLGADTVTLGSGVDTLVFTAQGQSSHGSGHDVIEGFDSAVDFIDLSALSVVIFWRGVVPNMAAGIGQLNVSWAGAFFNTGDDTLYIDINKDLKIDSSDLQIELSGVDSLSADNLIL